jgi:O-acetyl-ADP-ribose deacetylase (regulator of RNase III)
MLAIIDRQGSSIFDLGAKYLVNPVNCVGAMGAGLAKQFAERYPYMMEGYQHDCRYGNIRGGSLYIYFAPDGKHIINLATKEHWKDESRLEWVELGLKNLTVFLSYREPSSIAIPALGCGLGGLDWKDVKWLLEKFEREHSDWFVHIMEPRTG